MPDKSQHQTTWQLPPIACGYAALLALLCICAGPRSSQAHLVPTDPQNDVTNMLAQGLGIPVPEHMEVVDRAVDDGQGLLLSFEIPAADERTGVMAQILHDDGNWYDSAPVPTPYGDLTSQADAPLWFRADEEHGALKVIELSTYTAPGEDGEPADQLLKPTRSYDIRLLVYRDFADINQGRAEFFAGSAQPVEQWFNTRKINEVIIGLIMAALILGSIFAARSNPNLFIRRINGLEAVDEAIGRATEMGRPVLQVNGLDPLTTPSTVAAVNILGRIARRVAAFDSTLLVPSFDPVVMTVSQETVRQAYMEAGRPDAYREDSIFFVTDQQFSYVASVCGIMLREKPAANFFLGYFYAESLLLAETGASTGAIQIAGTDAQAQLPFFITTCDYTLIGEELYAASAYLSREPMLLGSLKGLDLCKVLVMLVLLIGTVLATLKIDTLTGWFTSL